MLNHALEWGGCLLLLLGLKLITDKKLVGFYSALVAEVLWIVWGIRTGAIGLVAMSTVIGLVYLRGIYLWKKDEGKPVTADLAGVPSLKILEAFHTHMDTGSYYLSELESVARKIQERVLKNEKDVM